MSIGMSHPLKRVSLGGGVHFNSISDPKFKLNRLAVYCILPLREETASENAVLPFLLRKGSKNIPDFTALNATLNDLYGATLGGDVGKFNGYQMINLSIASVDNRFALDGEDITARCAALLSDLLLDPNLDADGAFPATDVELERQYLIDSIEAEINDKRSYAVTRCVEVMCEGEPVAVNRYGDVERAAAITPSSAGKAWRRMIETAVVEIFFTGSGSPDSALETFRSRFAGLRRNPVDFAILPMKEVAESMRELEERMELTQAKLVMGLRVKGLDSMEKKSAARIFSALYGGTTFSKLFLGVREKLSLCYYCGAQMDVVNRMMLINSGIEAANRDKAEAEILHQLELVQQGDFTDEELQNTKLVVEGSLNTVGDSLSGLESWYLSQTLRGQELTPAEDIESLRAVTREQVIEAAKSVSLDTVYFLTGNDDEKEEA